MADVLNQAAADDERGFVFEVVSTPWAWYAVVGEPADSEGE